MDIQDIASQLKRDEGLRLNPYRDSAGKLSLGYGRNLDDVGISESEAEFMLANDINHVTEQLNTILPWTANLDRPRFGVLQNLAFNMGIGKLLEFRKTLAAIESGSYDEAASDMEASRWYGQVGYRAKRLVEQMKTGQWV